MIISYSSQDANQFVCQSWMDFDSLGEPSLSATKMFLAEREIGRREDELTDEMVKQLEEKMRTRAV